MQTYIEIKKGKELSEKDLKIINAARKKEFNSKNLIAPRPDNEHWQKKFFLLKDKNENLLAFARLHETEIEFNGIKYPVLGIATLIAIKKGHGYGKKLITFIKKYIEKTGITGLGFCNKKLTPYYQKIGFGIIKDGTVKTLYKNDEGVLKHDDWGGGDAIYVKGKDNLIKEILYNPEENILIFRPHW